MTSSTATLRSDVVLAHRKTAVSEVAALNEIEERNASEHRAFVRQMILVVSVFALLGALFWFIHGLRRRFVDAYAWWDSPAGYLSKRTQRPDGRYPGITVPSAAVAFTNPILASVQGALWQSTPVMSQAGLFLLEMASVFGSDRSLTGIHWNGSEEQLRYADLNLFLPTGPAAVTIGAGGTTISWPYVVQAFNATSTTDKGAFINPWAGTLWADKTGKRLMNSPAIVGYLRGDPKMTRLIKLLYRGGLCAVAHDFFDADTHASDVVYYLVGEKDPHGKDTRKCTASDRVSGAVQWGAITMGAVGGLGSGFLKLLGPGGFAASLLLTTFGGAALGATALSGC